MLEQGHGPRATVNGRGRMEQLRLYAGQRAKDSVGSNSRGYGGFLRCRDRRDCL